jgi:PAS domain S-box-containing protein
LRPTATLIHNLGFALAAALVAILAVRGLQSADAVLANNEDVRRSLELVSAVKSVRSSVLDVETGARGFVLTGRDEYLEPYVAGRAQWEREYQRLAALLRDRKPPRDAWLRDLHSGIEARIALSTRAIALRREGGLEAALAQTSTGSGKHAMDRIRALLDDLESEERTRLLAGREAVERQYTRTRRDVVLGGGIVGLLLLATFIAINLNLRTRRRLAERARAGEARMREQRAFLRTVVDADENLIYVRRGDGSFDLCNAAFASVFGARPEHLEGQPSAPIVARAPQLFAGDEDIAAGRLRGAHEEIGVVDATGAERWFQVARRSMDLPGDERRVLVVGLDISARREVEKLKAEFVSTVSHELRTPLTSIRGALGMLIGGMAGDVDPAARPLLDIAYKSCERLVRLINDLLDIEKLESGRLQLQMQPLQLRTLVEQAVEQNAAYAREFGVRIESRVDDGDAWVRGDADRLAQVMANLLSNAAKHSPPGGVVVIDAARIDGKVEIGVGDRGNGIPEEFRARVFERFSQADGSDARQRGGTGLGLAITKTLVEQHGGSIGFETATGEGTRFHFRLPTTPAPAPARLPDAATPDQPLVLIVDDDVDASAQLARILQARGYRTLAAATTARARALLSREPVHALTISLALRSEDPLGFVRNLRGVPEYRHLPILAVGVRPPESDARGLAGGAIGIGDWLSKPFDADRVVASVRACLDSRDHHAQVLHVEDDEDLRRLLGGLLEGEPLTLHGAATLAEARAALSARHHELVILDLMLPDGDGADLLDELAAARPPTRVIIFSARDTPLPDSTVILRRLVKSHHDGPELAALIHDQLQSWPRAGDHGAAPAGDGE